MFLKYRSARIGGILVDFKVWVGVNQWKGGLQKRLGTYIIQWEHLGKLWEGGILIPEMGNIGKHPMGMYGSISNEMYGGLSNRMYGSIPNT